MKQSDFFKAVDKGKMKRAKGILDELKDTLPRTRYLYLEGIYLLETGDPGEAVKRFDMALVLHLSDPELWIAKADALEEMGRLDMAKRSAERACRLDPENPYANFLLGRILYSMKKYAEAHKVMDKTLELDPHNAEALTIKGILISITEEDYREALTYFDRAIDEDTEYSKAWSNRGVALRQIGDRQGAVYSFHRSLVLDPGDRSSRKMLINMGEEELVEELDRARKRLKRKEK